MFSFGNYGFWGIFADTQTELAQIQSGIYKQVLLKVYKVNAMYLVAAHKYGINQTMFSSWFEKGRYAFI